MSNPQSPGSLLRSPRGVCWFALLTFAFTASSSSAHAGLTIIPTFDSTITSDSNAAAIEGIINQAISFYQSTFSNNITVNITFQEGGGLGSSSTAITQLTYSQARSALTTDAGNNPTDAKKQSAVANLPANNPVPGFSANTNMWVTTANARALGFAASTSSDGTITLNTSLTFPPNGQSGSTFSLLAVTEHEMDEVLGLGSGLNLPTAFPRLPRMEDLFRYSAAGTHGFSTSTSATAYFSIDGGTTNLDSFNQSGNGDYGDWVVHTPSQVQDWAGTPNTTPFLTASSVEVTALDVIGYDLLPAPVPEPTSVTLLAVVGLVGSTYYFRRRGSRSPETQTASAPSEENADAAC